MRYVVYQTSAISILTKMDRSKGYLSTNSKNRPLVQMSFSLQKHCRPEPRKRKIDHASQASPDVCAFAVDGYVEETILGFTLRRGSALIQLKIYVQNDVMESVPVIDKVHKLKLANIKVRIMSTSYHK